MLDSIIRLENDFLKKVCPYEKDDYVMNLEGRVYQVQELNVHYATCFRNARTVGVEIVLYPVDKMLTFHPKYSAVGSNWADYRISIVAYTFEGHHLKKVEGKVQHINSRDGCKFILNEEVI
jgi:hypothetical protein